MSPDSWFARNADRRNPSAAINRDPAYFGSECADAIAQGRLAETRRPPEGRVPPDSFCRTLAANIENTEMSDADFRQFVRNTMPIVDIASTKGS